MARPSRKDEPIQALLKENRKFSPSKAVATLKARYESEE